MANQLRDRFGPQEPGKGALLAEDFIFLPSEHGPLQEYRVERNSLGMLETPLAVTRRYVLSHAPDGIQIEFMLCLEGRMPAVALLFEKANQFQRLLPENIFDTARGQDVGDTGILWRWDRDDRNGVLGFVRHNLLVFMQGRYDTLLEAARSLDQAIAKLRTTTAYSDSTEKLLKTEAPRITRGERFNLDMSPDGLTRSFFIAEGGAVNLDPDNSERRYYRAGLRPGSFRITAYRVGAGLLPSRQTLPVTIN